MAGGPSSPIPKISRDRPGGFRFPEKHEAPGLAHRGLASSERLSVDYMPESVRISMTRRFIWRPSAVALSAIGLSSP
jgi:hypothetical protein